MTKVLKPHLDLSNAPSILFLFGLAGSGKSYVGELIAERAGWHIYHADDDLTNDMVLALQHKQAFTDEMREDFFNIVGKKILNLRARHSKLVVTQAVYKQTHRDYLLATIDAMEMILIDSSDGLITQRIERRESGISTHSAAALRQDFEYPDRQTKVIINNSDEVDIIKQLNQFYSADLLKPQQSTQ